ncbi:MAG: aldehyde dehydrogenase family protein [Polyangiaceae bacterium]|jgi:acyl-CoA reductase-like NAD-dependent aldehyde dehydrogenase
MPELREKTNGAHASHGAPAVNGVAVESSSSDAIRRAVAASRAAQEHWRLRPVESRIAALQRAAKQLLRRRAEGIELARSEMGKVDAEGLFIEALGPLDNVGAWARVVRRATARRRVGLNPISFAHKSAYVDAVPRGVVGVIAPWNFPIAGLYRPFWPALMTGNGVVLKPSEYTPRSSAWFALRLAEELPDGLVQVVQGDGQVGAQLIDAGIDACVFTGSPRTGHAVRVRCAERGIPSSIEMGGKDAAIVLADCNLSRSVAGITHWTLGNAGQACGAIEIAYVEQKIADDFVERMRAAWTRLTRESVAPLGNQRQLDVVRAQVDDARAKGARVVCGGTYGGDGLFYPPTLLDRCDERMAAMKDETFGPVLAIERIEGATEAIRKINRSRYGLGASIWTNDLARAERLAERLDVGVVNVNNHSFTGAIPSLPWSGTRETGFGVANGPESLATFVRPRVTAVDASRAPELYWMPYDATLRELGETLADAQIGRIAGAWKLPLLMRRRLKTLRDFFR